MSEFLKNSALLKENLLVLPEFLKNKYFVKGKPLKMSEFLKKKCLLKENLLVLPDPEFLKNKYFVIGKSPKNVRIPEKSTFSMKYLLSYILIPENDDFLKGKCPSFVCIFEK
jgi:hypothetical protein